MLAQPIASHLQQALQQLITQFSGQIHLTDTYRLMYATDASAYQEVPLAVALPATVADIKALIKFANQHLVPLIPRAAGTSLAGQVVGSGIIVDISKHFNNIIEINANEQYAVVQPGVVRDDLNHHLKPHGLLFGPETSTANRAMIGGMVGNNSCGSNSVVYRSTREHVLEIEALLSDGSEVVFKALSIDEFHTKCEGNSLENKIYRHIRSLLSNYDNQQEIAAHYPKPSIERRNTGYALDVLMQSAPFVAGAPAFNFCNLLAGSEGTLAFITQIKLNLVKLPPPQQGLVCIHFKSIHEALVANIEVMKFKPSASELIDHYILSCTKENIEQRENRFFVDGDPEAILVVEFCRDTIDELLQVCNALIDKLKQENLGYHFPILQGADCKRVWNLRKAGLGLLSNLPGDEKAVPVIEDTAVSIEDLPAYIQEFNAILQRYNLYSVHYAHAGSGELHLRPIINLKTEQGNQLFKAIAYEIAVLVKKYKGSLSGEHGDGRLRGEFIPYMIGEKNYNMLKELKQVWDANAIFNPNKIVDTPPMNHMLRYTPEQQTSDVKTYFRYHNQTVLQHAELCNGSGDCRKTHLSNGTMCPSYMATKNEKDTTRARANMLRHFLTHSNQINKFNHQEIYEVMDLCLSCKACKSECPSNVDMAKLKAEFLQHYYDANGVPFRSKVIASFATVAKLGSKVSGLYNFINTNSFTSKLIKKTIGFAPSRSLPTLSKVSLYNWYKQYKQPKLNQHVYLFCDEFIQYNEAEIGIKTIKLLNKLGYNVVIPQHVESGRAALSKGMLKVAKKYANQNVSLLQHLITQQTPLIGIEPSAILCFRDEYPDLVDDALVPQAKQIANNTWMLDEFLSSLKQAGKINTALFTSDTQSILLHGHCQQKAISNIKHTVNMLQIPSHYAVKQIPSGCCGMAGSFGYEKEHYDISMQVAELVLFPTIRKKQDNEIVAAVGTSCRHQIKDGLQVKALHPVEILYDALLNK